MNFSGTIFSVLKYNMHCLILASPAPVMYKTGLNRRLTVKDWKCWLLVLLLPLILLLFEMERLVQPKLKLTQDLMLKEEFVWIDWVSQNVFLSEFLPLFETFV
jgi:hypothetical protein